MPWTREQCRTSVPPDGWRWRERPMEDGGIFYNGCLGIQGGELTTVERWQVAMQNLIEWAVENDRALLNPRRNLISFDVPGGEVNNVEIINMVYVSPQFEWDTGHNAFDDRVEQECPFDDCVGNVNTWDIECPTCHRNLRCRGCHSPVGVRPDFSYGEVTNPEHPMRFLGCEGCFAHCVWSDGRTVCTRPTVGSYCVDHATYNVCDVCQTIMPEDMTYNSGGVQHCYGCRSRICRVCGTFENTSRDPEDRHGRSICGPCAEVQRQHRLENLPYEAMTAEELLLPSLPARPIRLTSIEQEFDRGGASVGISVGDALAGVLHNDGLSRWGAIMRYHCGAHDRPCHVEADSSVNGGELIYNRLKMDDPIEAGHMENILRRVREYQESGSLDITYRCGTHIHVDLHGYTVDDARNLVTVYNYLEDPIFRLAAAGYPDHRMVTHARDYSRPLRKGKWADAVEFGNDFLRRADHTDSLNLQWFYQALRQGCRCGAMEFGGGPRACTCARPKCTAEWRVFNGTNNPRKLHAYMAFTQSITSWCQQREIDLDFFEPLELRPGCNFARDDNPEAKAELIEEWKPRMEWMFRNLVMTAGERASMIFCIHNSPLRNLGTEFIDRLARLQPIEDTRVLEAPMVAMRTANAVIEFDDDGDGYCRNCGEDYDYCRCADLAEAPRDPFVDGP